MTLAPLGRMVPPRPERRALHRLALALCLAAPLPLLPPPVAAQIRGELVEDPRPGQRAPSLVLPRAAAAGQGSGAEPYDLTRELGRVVVLVFCPRLAAEECGAAWQELSRPSGGFPAGVSVVGVTGDSPADAVARGGALGGGGHLLTDDRLRTSRRWGAGRAGRVAVFLIGPEGLVSYRDLQFSLSEPEDLTRLRAAVTRARDPAGTR